MKQKLLSLLTALCLLVSLTLPALAAESAEATTLRLKSTEGTVTLTNKNGKPLSLREDMKLYSGYTVTTEASSYAYISLDDTKAVKLDASSSAEIKKNGKQLEVLLKSGNLFFNVTAPLERDETLNIRTSTMVTGIRGTAGAVTQSSVFLLDGSVTLYTVDETTGEVHSTPLAAGQQATMEGGASAPSTKDFIPQELPSVAGTEVAKDPVLQEKITQETTLDVTQIVQTASEKQAQEQSAQKAAADKLAAAVGQPQKKVEAAPPGKSNAKPTEKPDSADREERDDSNNSGNAGTPGNGGNSGNSGNTGTPENPEPPEVPDDSDPPDGSENPGVPPTELTLTEPTYQALKDALDQDGIRTVRLSATAPVELTGNLSIPSELTLSVVTGGLSLSSAAQLTIDGTLDLAAGTTLSADGVVVLSDTGTVKNLGAIALQAGSAWKNDGTVRSDEFGTFSCDGTLTMRSGLIHSTTGYALTGSGTVQFTGGLFGSDTESDVVSDSMLSTGTELNSIPVLSGAQGSTYVKGVGLSAFLEAVGTTPTTINLAATSWANQTTTIADGQRITLKLPDSGSTLNYQGRLLVEGELTLDTGTISFDQNSQFEISGKLALVNSCNLTFNGSSVMTGAGEINLNNGEINFASGSTFTCSGLLSLGDGRIWSSNLNFCLNPPAGYVVEFEGAGGNYLLVSTP